MYIVDVHGNQRVPEILYHYTTHSGFLGIAKTKTLWCTSISYLSDGKEYLHAYDLLIERLDYKIRNSETKPLNSVSKRRLSSIKKGLSQLGTSAFFVGSLSEKKDLLSQWRAYSSGVDGICIGLDAKRLKKLANEQAFRLVKCVYDTEQQKDIVDNFIDKFLEKGTNLGKEQDLPILFSIHFSWLAPVLKHESFQEEQEWRLISYQMSVDNPKIDVHKDSSILIPHFNFDLIQEEEELNLKELVIGPSNNQELASISIQATAIKYSVKLKHLTFSNSPYKPSKY